MSRGANVSVDYSHRSVRFAHAFPVSGFHELLKGIQIGFEGLVPAVLGDLDLALVVK